MVRGRKVARFLQMITICPEAPENGPTAHKNAIRFGFRPILRILSGKKKRPPSIVPF